MFAALCRRARGGSIAATAPVVGKEVAGAGPATDGEWRWWAEPRCSSRFNASIFERGTGTGSGKYESAADAGCDDDAGGDAAREPGGEAKESGLAVDAATADGEGERDTDTDKEGREDDAERRDSTTAPLCSALLRPVPSA